MPSTRPSPASSPASAEYELTVEQLRDRTRRLVLRYVLTSTLLLFVGGALGVVLRREPGRPVITVSPIVWYELMTAHGLATFVGWAAFCLMGVSYWVLQESGFLIRGWGYRWAVASWWTMVAGVVGIVITVLARHFAGSWVFLYPLPFYVDRAVVGDDDGAVLAVGDRGRTVDLHLLLRDARDRDGHGARRARRASALGHRILCALGFGFLRRERYRDRAPAAVRRDPADGDRAST